MLIHARQFRISNQLKHFAEHILHSGRKIVDTQTQSHLVLKGA